MTDISPNSLDDNLFEAQINWHLIQIEISKYDLSYSSPENISTKYFCNGCLFWRQNRDVRNYILDKPQHPKLITWTYARISPVKYSHII